MPVRKTRKLKKKQNRKVSNKQRSTKGGGFLCCRRRGGKTTCNNNCNSTAENKPTNTFVNNSNTRGGALATMPQLCFGTVQTNLESNLTEALKIGYRHIDGAEVYTSIHMSGEYGPKIDYKATLKKVFTKFKQGENGLPKVERKDLWITWKDNNITKAKIETTIKALDCEYLDLYLVHHSCGTEKDFEALKEAQKAGLIRYYGVSNCEKIEKIEQLKKAHNIYANQIQARPPGGIITRGYGGNRVDVMDTDFIEKCNKLGVHIMLFSTTTGVTQTLNHSQLYEVENFDLGMINKYYIQKFLKPSNVLIVSSAWGSSIKINYDLITTFLSGTPLLTKEQMESIEEALKKITLAHM